MACVGFVPQKAPLLTAGFSDKVDVWGAVVWCKTAPNQTSRLMARGRT